MVSAETGAAGYLSRVWRLLERSERRTALVLMVVLLVGTLLDVLSLSLFLPLISALSGDGQGIHFPVVSNLVRTSGDAATVARIFSLLVAVFVAKGAFTAWSIWYQRGFASTVERRMSSDLFTRYVNRPYQFHLDNNSSMLMRNVGMASQFVTFSVDSILVLATDGAVLIATVVMLAVIEPLGTSAVVVSTLSVAAFFYLSTRSRVSKWGASRLDLDASRIQYLQEGFGAIKEIKVLHRESQFIKRFDDTIQSWTHINRGYTTLTSLPRIWLELITLLGMTTLVGVQLLQGKTVSETLPVLGVFAAGSFRVMPSVNRIVFAVQNLKFSRPALELLHADLKSVHEPVIAHIDGELPLSGSIEFRKVSFAYPGRDTEAVSEIDFLIKPGQAVGFVGSSGAGKSTLVDLLLGLLNPESGEILVGGVPRDSGKLASKVSFGYVPQVLFLTDDTLRNNIALGVPDSEIDEARLSAVIEKACLVELVGELPDGVNTMLGERGVRLSGGQRQRIGIARALYPDPDVLILDEATSALDIRTEQEIIDEISAIVGNKTLVIVAHRLTSVAICGTVHQVEAGRIVMSGSPEGITQRILAEQEESKGQI